MLSGGVAREVSAARSATCCSYCSAVFLHVNGLNPWFVLAKAGAREFLTELRQIRRHVAGIARLKCKYSVGHSRPVACRRREFSELRGGCLSPPCVLFRKDIAGHSQGLLIGDGGRAPLIYKYHHVLRVDELSCDACQVIRTACGARFSAGSIWRLNSRRRLVSRTT